MKQEINKELLGIAYKEVCSNLKDINSISSILLSGNNFDFTTMEFKRGV